MNGDPVDAAGCLRSLTAEALMRAHRGSPLFPVSLGLQAVGNAFVMLGLLPEPQAEAILAEHRSALERAGFGNTWGVTKGELTVRPGAHEYWQARTGGPANLREVPLLVAAAGVRCPTSIADVCFEWVKLTSTGLRVSFHATADDPGDDGASPHGAMLQAISEISVRDDTGQLYDLTNLEGADWSRAGARLEWHADALADPNPSRDPAWLEFASARSAASGRVALPPPANAPVGRSEPPWPTPAECYLAELAGVISLSISDSDNEARAGQKDTADIIAMVADSLMAVGALPVTSSLLAGVPGVRAAAWQRSLMNRWVRRARHDSADFRPSQHRGLAVRLPLQHATAVIESVSAESELVGVRLYGHPWMMGEYWPMITPCFQVHATDDIGNEHEGIPSGWHATASHEGSGSFFFWPPVHRARKSIRVTVSTLWEAAWAEVGLPR